MRNLLFVRIAEQRIRSVSLKSILKKLSSIKQSSISSISSGRNAKDAKEVSTKKLFAPIVIAQFITREQNCKLILFARKKQLLDSINGETTSHPSPTKNIILIPDLRFIQIIPFFPLLPSSKLIYLYVWVNATCCILIFKSQLIQCYLWIYQLKKKSWMDELEKISRSSEGGF